MIMYYDMLKCFLFLFYTKMMMIYDKIKRFALNAQLVKIKTNDHKYHAAGYMLYLSEFFLKLLVSYNKMIPHYIKKILLYLIDYETELLEYEIYNNNCSTNKIIKATSLYKSLKVLQNNLSSSPCKSFVLLNLSNLLNIYLIKKNNKSENLLATILKYIGHENNFIDVISFITLTSEKENIFEYDISFEKLNDDLISTESITVPLKDFKNRTIDDVLKSI